MLKNRLIPVILLKGELVVQSLGFNRYLPIGNVSTAIEFFVNWDVDEIIILDIEASSEKRDPRIDIVKEACQSCFLPLSVGGGIRDIDQIKKLLRSGADKVVINEAAYLDSSFIKKAVEVYGSSTVTASIDVCKRNDEYECHYRNGKISSGKNVKEWVLELDDLGVGEILINSIDRDGSRRGYDIDLLKLVTSATSKPVIACGGVGDVTHFTQGIKEGRCDAVAAANIFQHLEHSTIAAKAFLKKSKVSIRLDSEATYENYDIDTIGRPVPTMIK